MKIKLYKNIKVGALLVMFLVISAFTIHEPPVNYKCMIQMTNYTGEKAYVVVSLVNPQGEYEKTLYVQGDDKEWYPDLKQWWAHRKASSQKVDAITGATIGNGERNIISLQFNEDQMNKGYKIRFESAVENQKYYTTDAEVNLDTETITNKVDGKGYIRYIRILPN